MLREDVELIQIIRVIAVIPDIIEDIFYIGAESPAEIGVCIIAEVVNVYRGGRAESLSDALRGNRHLPLHPTRVQNYG